jgi:hypothetical protein
VFTAAGHVTEWLRASGEQLFCDCSMVSAFGECLVVDRRETVVACFKFLLPSFGRPEENSEIPP